MNTKVYFTLKQQSGQNVIDCAFDNFKVGTLTTDHSRSSYGIPVILADGSIVDYSAIQSITLPFESAGMLPEVQSKLAPFVGRISADTAGI